MDSGTLSLLPGLFARRVFLGWDQPCAHLVAEWLSSEPDKLRRRLIVVPTRESGRRLRELLAEKALKSGIGAVLGPRVATPEDFFRPEKRLPDSVRWAGWLAVLQKTSDADISEVFPRGISGKDDAWLLGIARQIDQARDLLVAANLTFNTVARTLLPEADRWSQLASLEKKLINQWKRWGYEDPVQARLDRVARPDLPPGVDELVLAAVTDPTQLAITAWQNLALKGARVTVLVCAPAKLAAQFDAWGRPDPGHWTDRSLTVTPLPGDVVVAADAAGLAEAVVQGCQGMRNTGVGIGICAGSFLPVVARRFLQAGWTTYDPQGLPAAYDGWPALLEALAGALESPAKYNKLAPLIRHPFTWRTWLDEAGARSAFAELDEWERKACPFDAAAAIRLLQASDKEPLQACANLLDKAGGLAGRSRSNSAALVEQLLIWASENQPVHDLLREETAAWARIKGPTLPQLLRLLATSTAALSSLSEHPREAVPLQGWLELMFEPAAHLTLAALHEGSVPEAPPANPLITDILREQLRFRDRKSRLAREIYLYSAMVNGRAKNGFVRIVTAQVDPLGEPCRPSRVLLQADQETLPERVELLFKERSDVPSLSTPAWSRGEWRIEPAPGLARNRHWEQLSPSKIRAYLACPTRFYFAEVLGWKPFERFDEELDPGQFGDLFHEVFKIWGEDRTARDQTNPLELSRYWLGLMEDLIRGRFGSDLPPLLQLQLLSARERLTVMAHEQARQRLEGWCIDIVETTFPNLRLAGIPVNMRIDRVDRHLDGRARVIDYKTGRAGDRPDRTHLGFWNEERCPAPLGPLIPSGNRQKYWKDLQLPLYAKAVQQHYQLEELPSAYYAVLPESVSDTEFIEFKELGGLIDSAMEWAEAAGQAIISGRFWPPAPSMTYDDLVGLAPEGLELALGPEWAAWFQATAGGTKS